LDAIVLEELGCPVTLESAVLFLFDDGSAVLHNELLLLRDVLLLLFLLLLLVEVCCSNDSCFLWHIPRRSNIRARERRRDWSIPLLSLSFIYNNDPL
jgi:hypothetical protein